MRVWSMLALSFVLISTAAIPDRIAARQAGGSRYLVTWAGDADRADSDFLAVVDVAEESPTYGEVLATVPVGASGTYPHHTEHVFTPGAPLFANGFGANRTFRFDLSEPRRPQLLGEAPTSAPLAFPHSFERLPNGNLLATMQARNAAFEGPGGLAEIDNDGRVVRTSSAAAEGIAPNALRPYSLAIVPAADRVVTASSRMGLPPWDSDRRRESHEHEGHHVQLWRLSDLALLKTIELDALPGSTAHLNPAEPRVLADGTVLLSTSNCGLYRIRGLEPGTFGADLVYRHEGPGCWVPAVVGRYWIQTISATRRVVVLDVANPGAPAEVSRLQFDERQAPHWLVADAQSDRVAMLNNPGMPDHRIWMLRLDRATGQLSIDEHFRSTSDARAGISFDRSEWPHGATGDAIPHGTVWVR